MNFTNLYINGEWVTPNSKEIIEVENPATKKIIGSVPKANSNDVNMAVEAANLAFETWQYTDIDYRIKFMNNLVIELEKRVEQMAEVVRDELGCGLKFAKDIHVKLYIEEIIHLIELIENYEFEEIYDDHRVLKEPIGVVGALTPWNYPFGQIIKKIVPAILTGNTVVLKPSQNTPLVAFILTEAIHEAGFPKGVFNLVSGKGSEVGDLIAKHEDIKMVSFTGSTNGGIEVAKIALSDVKKIALELGGKSASIILKGADLDLAIKRTLDKVYNNTGQSCSAYSRLLVPKDEKDKIEKLIIDKTKEYKFGNPSDPDTMIGPLASKKQFDKVSYYIQKGLDEGAILLVGEVPTDDSNGYYVGPTVFTDVNNDMEIARNEIFGPVLSIITYEDEDDAIRIANDNKYGLSGAVFGPDDDAYKVARKMKTGGVLVNNGKQTFKAPFGGYKQSGIGREGGIYGIEEYLEIKSLYI